MSTAMSCPTCGTTLTLIIDFIKRQTYWCCQACWPAHLDGNIVKSSVRKDGAEIGSWTEQYDETSDG